MTQTSFHALIASAFAVLLTAKADAQSSPAESSKPATYLLGAQATFIQQFLPAFRSPYTGVNSLPSIPQCRLSDTYTLYLGARVSQGFEVYPHSVYELGADQ